MDRKPFHCDRCSVILAVITPSSRSVFGDNYQENASALRSNEDIQQRRCLDGGTSFLLDSNNPILNSDLRVFSTCHGLNSWAKTTFKTNCIS